MGTREFDIHELPRVTDMMLRCGLTRLVRPRGHVRIRHQIENCWTWVSRSYKTEMFRTRILVRVLKTEEVNGFM